MKKYNIKLQEILERILTINANSEKEALEIANNLYDDGDETLDYDDLKQVNITLADDNKINGNNEYLNNKKINKLKQVGILDSESTYNYNIGSSDYAKKSLLQPWHVWQLWDWLTSFDHDIIKRLYRNKSGESRILDYEKIIHICKERIRQLSYEHID